MKGVRDAAPAPALTKRFISAMRTGRFHRENNCDLNLLVVVLKSICILVLLLGSAALSPAAVINFQIDIKDNTLAGWQTDIPVFSVTNRSDAAKITKLEVHIGLVSKNFDRVGGFTTAPTGAARVTPDLINASVRGNTAVFTFSNFDPGEKFGFFAEIDDDLVVSSAENYRHILFDNGPGPNGYAKATFSDAAGLHSRTIVFQDTAGPLFQLSQVAVPEPATEMLLAAGFGALGFYRRRR
jgi:hypothetical protein